MNNAADPSSPRSPHRVTHHTVHVCSAFVVGVSVGAVLAGIAYARLRNQVNVLERNLAASEETVEHLGDANLERSHHEIRSRMKIADMARRGATTREIVQAAMHALSGVDSSNDALESQAAILKKLRAEWGEEGTPLLNYLDLTAKRPVDEP